MVSSWAALSLEEFAVVVSAFQLFHGFIMGSLKSEEFAVVVSAFLLASFNFSSYIISLGFPFSNNLVEVASTLLGDDGSSVGTFVFHGNFFQVGLHSALGFFSISCLQLVARRFQLVNTSQAFGFITRSP